MNILMIGNGFDIAHGLPTKYSDFLEFCYRLRIIFSWSKDENQYSNNHIRTWKKWGEKAPGKYLIEAFKSRKTAIIPNEKLYSLESYENTNKYVQEMYECINNNIWYNYFEKIYKENLMNGDNWIDFESEIKRIVKLFDEHTGYMNSAFKKWAVDDEGENEFLQIFFGLLSDNVWKIFRLSNNKNEKYIIRFNDLNQIMNDDLDKITRCLEIYLTDCVEKIGTNKKLKEIEDILSEFSDIRVFSFNYTHTLETIYNINSNHIHYIHGECKKENTISTDNMVLGIDEYWSEAEKNLHTNYSTFKKFWQRIIKSTKNDYREWLVECKNEYTKSAGIRATVTGTIEFSNLYIFGHSLDVTDKDLLREFLLHPGICTTIYYYNKVAFGQQVTNLIGVLGQDNLNQMYKARKIRFIQQ